MFAMFSTAVAVAFLASQVAVEPASRTTCDIDDGPARIVRSAIPEIPQIAKQLQFNGTSVIRLDLSDTGDLVAASVARSSGYDILDRAAIQTARSMVYAPETRSCVAMPGSYALKVEFSN